MDTIQRQDGDARNPTEVAACGCPYDPEYDEGSLGWHLKENHPEVVATCPSCGATGRAERVNGGRDQETHFVCRYGCVTTSYVCGNLHFAISVPDDPVEWATIAVTGYGLECLVKRDGLPDALRHLADGVEAEDGRTPGRRSSSGA